MCSHSSGLTRHRLRLVSPILDHRSRKLHNHLLVPHLHLTTRYETTQRDAARVIQYGGDMSHRDADGGEDENGGFALGIIFTVVARHPIPMSTELWERGAAPNTCVVDGSHVISTSAAISAGASVVSPLISVSHYCPTSSSTGGDPATWPDPDYDSKFDSDSEADSDPWATSTGGELQRASGSGLLLWATRDEQHQIRSYTGRQGVRVNCVAPIFDVDYDPVNNMDPVVEGAQRVLE